MQNNSPEIRAILFDLDGTLIDTAPDMAEALNIVRQENGMTRMAFDDIRNHVSHGSAAMISVGFDNTLSASDFESLRERFIEIYAENIFVKTRLFPGIPETLAILEQQGIIWGVVTNKPGFLSMPIIEALELNTRVACLVSGDMLPQRKPHPDPLLYAATLMKLDPENCCYLGDAERDIAAGRAAGMRTLIADWGYIENRQQTKTWGADMTLETPLDLITWLEKKRVVTMPSISVPDSDEMADS